MSRLRCSLGRPPRAGENVGAKASTDRPYSKREPMRTVLVVEDVELNRDLLGQILEDHYLLVFAVDGAEGLVLAAELRPDLILMDLSLPVLDGWEATRRLKADPELARIPVVALTAHAMTGEEAKARAAGADDFLTKPVDEELLLEKLSRWLP